MSYHLHQPLHWAHNSSEETNYPVDFLSNYPSLFLIPSSKGCGKNDVCDCLPCCPWRIFFDPFFRIRAEHLAYAGIRTLFPFGNGYSHDCGRPSGEQCL